MNLSEMRGGLSTEVAQEMQKGSRDDSTSGGECEGWFREEACQEALFKFFRCGADRAAVVSVGDFPENYPWILSLNTTRVADGNITINLAVNKEYGNAGCGHGIFRRDLRHVEAIPQTDVKECELDDRPKDRAPEPGAKMEGLARAVVRDLAESGERGFGGDRAEPGLDAERLQKFGSAHRFAKSKDTARAIMCG